MMLGSESIEAALTQRFGSATEGVEPAVGPLLRHRSVRRFRPEPVSPELKSSLEAAALSAATSSHLHLWSAVAVQDPASRRELAEFTGGQRQVENCGLFYAFLADLHRGETMARRHEIDPDGLPFVESFTMAVIDASLAAERLVIAAELAGLGTCYIGGLRNRLGDVQRLLRLPVRVFPVFGLCVGWPNEDRMPRIKPRWQPSSVFHAEAYLPTPDPGEFDDRMRRFYQEEGMPEPHEWSLRSAHRLRVANMSGRQNQRPWLQSNGFPLD